MTPHKKLPFKRPVLLALTFRLPMAFTKKILKVFASL